MYLTHGRRAEIWLFTHWIPLLRDPSRARDRRQSESSRVLRRAYTPSSSVWRPRGSRGKGEEEPASKRSRHHALERASGQQRQHQHARRRRGEAGCTAISSLDSVALQHSSSGARLSVSGASSLPDLKHIMIVHFAIFFVVVRCPSRVCHPAAVRDAYPPPHTRIFVFAPKRASKPQYVGM